MREGKRCFNGHVGALACATGANQELVHAKVKEVLAEAGFVHTAMYGQEERRHFQRIAFSPFEELDTYAKA